MTISYQYDAIPIIDQRLERCWVTRKIKLLHSSPRLKITFLDFFAVQTVVDIVFFFTTQSTDSIKLRILSKCEFYYSADSIAERVLIQQLQQTLPNNM